MKKLLLALALLLLPSAAFGQCSGVFGANQVCGSLAGGPPRPTPSTSFPIGIVVGATTVTGGSSTGVLYNNSGLVGADAGLTWVPGGPLTITPTASSYNQTIVSSASTPNTSTVGPFYRTWLQDTFSGGISNSGVNSSKLNNGNVATLGAYMTSGNYGASNVTSIAAGLFFLQDTVGNHTQGTDTRPLALWGYGNVTATGTSMYVVDGGVLIGPSGSYNGLTGAEIDVGILAGGSAVSRRGLNLISIASVQGTTIDTAIQISTVNSYETSTGWQHLIWLSNAGGQIPLTTTATLFTSDAALTIGSVFDYAGPCTGGAPPCNLTVTGNILSFPNIRMTGAGSTCFGCTTDPIGGHIAVGGVFSTSYQIQASGASQGVVGLLSSANTTTGSDLVDILTSTSSLEFIFAANEPARTTTRYGITLGNYAEVSAFGAGLNGLIIGTNTNVPIVFGTNNIERMRLTGGGVLQYTLNGLGSTAADGIIVQNTTTAAAGAQQQSPNVHFIGQGWKTNATAASQTVEYIVNVLPIQGAANPTGLLQFFAQVNAGGYVGLAQLDSAGTFNVTLGYEIAGAAPSGQYIRGNGTRGVFSAIQNTDLPNVNYFSGVGTSGGIPYFSSTTQLASSALLTANAIIIGGGAGTAPSTTTTGAGVLTAIAVAVNTNTGLLTATTANVAAGAILVGGGSGNPPAAVADVATGSLLASGGVGSNPIYCAACTLTTSLNIGPGTINSGELLALNGNAASLPAGQFSQVYFHIGAADTTALRVVADSFGANNSYSFRRTNGTNGARTTLVNGNGIGSFFAEGYNGTNYTMAACCGAIKFNATETWTTSTNGTEIEFDTVANGGVGVIGAMKLLNSGGLSISNNGSTFTDALQGGLWLGGQEIIGSPTGGGKGAGTINVATEYYKNGTPLLAGAGTLRYALIGINFNSANTDNSLTITLPAGVTRYAVQFIRISNASASISTATLGVFTAAAGGGQTIAANQAITVTQSGTDTNNNTMQLTGTNGTTEAYNDTTLFIRVGTAQGSAATADVIIIIIPLT